MFSTTYKVTFSETDPGGILFFAEIFKIAHIVYEQFFDSSSFKINYFIDNDIAIPIVHTEADFFSPIKFGDILKCRLNVEELGSTSFKLSYKFLVDEKIVASVKTAHVVIMKHNFEKTPIPAEILAMLKQNIIT